MKSNAVKRPSARRATRTFSWRTLRISVLTLSLVLVALGSWLSRYHATSWKRPLWVVAFPINGDGSAVSSAYIATLTRAHFAPIEQYLSEQAQSYGVAHTTPMEIRLGPQLHEIPPEPPDGGSVLRVVAWSLHLRWWAWRAASAYDGPPIDVRVFLVYHDPALSPRLAHSLGLKEGMIGVAHVFASGHMAGSNNVVIAHELLHTVGATDKYDLGTNLPRFPEGYAEPERAPRYPQSRAELMGGRRPLSANVAEIPRSLAETLIGPITASEIRWQREVGSD